MPHDQKKFYSLIEILTNLKCVQATTGVMSNGSWTQKPLLSILRSCGGGSHSTVWEVQLHRSEKHESVKDKKYATKIIIKKNGNYYFNMEKRVIQEAKLLVELKHPHVIKCYGAFEHAAAWVIIYKLATETLAERLRKVKRFEERETRGFIRQLIKGLAYMHSKHILHGNIQGEDFDIIIAGFGFAAEVTLGQFRENMYARQKQGYMAPEQYSDMFNVANDMWSAGAIAYTCLTGSDIFGDFKSYWNITQDIEETIQELITGANAIYYIQQLLEEMRIRCHIPGLGKEFLQQCLEKDPKQRLTTRQALGHKWLKRGESKGETNPTPVHSLNKKKLDEPAGTRELKVDKSSSSRRGYGSGWVAAFTRRGDSQRTHSTIAKESNMQPEGRKRPWSRRQDR
ncbi:kinase-like protein [Fomitiporia mediterranea MF3/22]|uniref:kinase-like protein n=1 Tax=Fomitiporia mediterranea (strain MF3/22) TaxID=694068 RepID=UPI0004409CD7|nr:kinase-like protein [Fomitiporia mediterranea MF3/22]EJD07956.1 kinase-like protein [Fomitiporia mediterranea MF3/22]